MAEKNHRCLFHFVTWTSVLSFVLLVGGLGFHFYTKGRMRHLSSLWNNSDGNINSNLSETTSSSPVNELNMFNDTDNDIPVGNISGSLLTNGVKRIAMEGSVNQISNIFKRFGKFPPPQEKPLMPLHKSVMTSPSESITMATYETQVNDLDLQLENEIIRPGTTGANLTTFQSEKLRLSLSSTGVEAAGEARSPPSYVQSRPVYSKPAPKLPKLLFKPPTPKENEINGQANGSSGTDPNLVTQTVYGFLDFVTTIGNTVMVFTPQTKKVENVKPSSTSETVIQATVAPSSSISVASKTQKSVVSASSIVLPAPSGTERKGKGFHFEESISGPSSLIEASEYEPQVFATSFSSSSSSDLDETTALESHVVVSPVASSVSIKNKPKQVHPPPFVQIRTEVNVVSATEELQSPQVVVVTPASTSSKAFTSSKGFTLKLPQRSLPVLVSPVSSPLVVTAEKVFHPPPPPPPPSSPKPQETYQEEEQDEPTGLVSQTFNTQVADGVTTVHETKIIGTYIGSQYARIFESSSSVLPVAPSAQVIITPSKPAQAAASSTAPQSSIRTEESVVTNGDNYETSGEVFNDDDDDDDVDNHANNYDYDAYSHDSHQQQRLESNEYQEDNGNNANDGQKNPSNESAAVEPTPTASEEQTHYVLPQNSKEKKAEIYISPVPNNNAYSRQPQLYVDINPAKSVDFIVTATPSNRGKPGRGSRNEYKNRFSNRFNKNSTPSSDVVEAKEQEKIEEDTRDSGRRPSRFRSRSRSTSRQNAEDVVPTVSVYSQVVSATPTRRFGSGRGGAKTKEVAFKTIQSTRSFGASARQVQVNPTSSTSIYRFKLNRPTGRWRFKPSPKPKVNIIKTQEEEELEQQQLSEQSAAAGLKDLNTAGSGPNLNAHDDEDELAQHSDNLNYEESRTETNEVAQDLEPELAPQTIRVSTVTPTEFEDLEKFLEIATIKSPYVFQAGNVKNTRYITVTKTFTREPIQPTLASSIDDPTIENILATKPAYEKILEGSSDVATLPVIQLSGDMATPPLETITQSFSTTQLMLKTSILPVLYDGITTLYTLTQSYFVTRLVTAHKTVPPMELFQFVPTKSLTEFNTALQEAGSEHSEQLLGSEDSDDPETVYAHIIAPPDELTSLGADFDPSTMDDKIPKISAPRSKGAIRPDAEKVAAPASGPPNNPALGLNGLADQLGLTAEQLAFLQFLKSQKQPTQPPTVPNNLYQQFAPQLVPNPVGLTGSAAPQLQLTSSPVVIDTTTTVVESKTLRLQFGAKPTYTTLYSTKVVPTRMTSYVTMSIAVAPTAVAPIGNPFFNPAAFPLAYLG